MKAHFVTFARYNAWANGRVYDAAALLSDAQYREDRGAAFKSLHGTLNHLLVADRIWMQRFTGEGDAPAQLDAILFDDLVRLRRAREAADRLIIDFVEGLDDAALDQDRHVARDAGCIGPRGEVGALVAPGGRQPNRPRQA